MTLAAFPTAEGWGADALGGRGPAGTTPAQRKVCFVTNLNDSGPGSFRDAVETQTVPRFVVFRVGGTISCNTMVALKHPYCYIAGQSAPGGGICLRNGPSNTNSPLGIGTHDVIVRHMRFRSQSSLVVIPAGGVSGLRSLQCNTSISTSGGYELPNEHIIIDHCSISWGNDMCAQTGDGCNYTSWQYCLISEGLEMAGHK